MRSLRPDQDAVFKVSSRGCRRAMAWLCSPQLSRPAGSHATMIEYWVPRPSGSIDGLDATCTPFIFATLGKS